MSFHAHFPFLDGLVDPSTAERLEQRFNDACAEAGVDTDAREAQAIGIGLIADYASGWAASPSAPVGPRIPDQTPD